MKSPVKSPAALIAPGRALTFANVAEGAEGLVVADLARAVAAKPVSYTHLTLPTILLV